MGYCYDNVRIKPIDTFPSTIHFIIEGDSSVMILRVFNISQQPFWQIKKHQRLLMALLFLFLTSCFAQAQERPHTLTLTAFLRQIPKFKPILAPIGGLTLYLISKTFTYSPAQADACAWIRDVICLRQVRVILLLLSAS